MTRIVRYQDSSGAILQVEVAQPGGNFREAADKDVVLQSEASIDTAMATVRGAAEALTAQIESLAKKPSQVEVEFGLSFKVEGGVIVVKGSAEANLTVKLTWSS